MARTRARGSDGPFAVARREVWKPGWSHSSGGVGEGWAQRGVLQAVGPAVPVTAAVCSE